MWASVCGDPWVRRRIRWLIVLVYPCDIKRELTVSCAVFGQVVLICLCSGEMFVNE